LSVGERSWKSVPSLTCSGLNGLQRSSVSEFYQSMAGFAVPLRTQRLKPKAIDPASQMGPI